MGGDVSVWILGLVVGFVCGCTNMYHYESGVGMSRVVDCGWSGEGGSGMG